MDAHNESGTLYNLTFAQIKQRVEILSKAGFKPEQIRVLLKYGICGQVASGVLDAYKSEMFDDKDVEIMNIARYKE